MKFNNTRTRRIVKFDMVDLDSWQKAYIARLARTCEKRFACADDHVNTVSVTLDFAFADNSVAVTYGAHDMCITDVVGGGIFLIDDMSSADVTSAELKNRFKDYFQAQVGVTSAATPATPVAKRFIYCDCQNGDGDSCDKNIYEGDLCLVTRFRSGNIRTIIGSKCLAENTEGLVPLTDEIVKQAGYGWSK